MHAKNGFQKYQREVHSGHADLFRSLENGQQPETLMITCSDSRIDPALVTQTKPGELFVIRTAGNLVPRYTKAGSSESATIEYAVLALGVKHIVVCGHRNCGAMAAVLEPTLAKDLPAVTSWLELAGPERLTGEHADLEGQVRANVKAQLANLRTHPHVEQAERRGDLELHGWVYDFVNGEMYELQPSDEFRPLSESMQL